ncbi:hypothetical protein AVEN_181912-1 [Araneus ventricosus]|uniref:Uncharacterized protein n=1 Tax=Araneus ventricosus TaxID=182803 RepID=A0A4Y2RTX6_ARAVE|nr:hypothetical protein AVEN_181912-1 [Araneus ventricosus]
MGGTRQTIFSSTLTDEPELNCLSFDFHLQVAGCGSFFFFWHQWRSQMDGARACSSVVRNFRSIWTGVRVPDKTTVLKTRADNSEKQNLQSKHAGEMSGITFDKAKFNVGLRDYVVNMLGKIESSVKSNTKVSN